MQFGQNTNRRMRADCMSCASRLIVRSIARPNGIAWCRQPTGPARSRSRRRARSFARAEREPRAGFARAALKPCWVSARALRHLVTAHCEFRHVSRAACTSARGHSEGPGNPAWAPCEPRAGPVRQLRSSQPPREPRGLGWIPVGPHSAGPPRGSWKWPARSRRDPRGPPLRWTSQEPMRVATVAHFAAPPESREVST